MEQFPLKSNYMEGSKFKQILSAVSGTLSYPEIRLKNSGEHFELG